MDAQSDLNKVQPNTSQPNVVLVLLFGCLGSGLVFAWIVILLQWLQLQHIAAFLLFLSLVFVVAVAFFVNRWRKFTPVMSPAKAYNETALKVYDASPQLQGMIQKAVAFLAQEDLDHAAMEYKKISEAALIEHSAFHPLYLAALVSQAKCLFGLGQVWSAKKLIQQAYGLALMAFPAEHPLLLEYGLLLAECLESCFEFSEAVVCRKSLLDLALRLNAKGAQQSIPSYEAYLANAYYFNGDWMHCRELISKRQYQDDPLLDLAASLLEASTLALSGQKEEARQMGQRITETMSRSSYDKRSAPYLDYLSRALNFMVALGQYAVDDDMFKMVEGFIADQLERKSCPHGNIIINAVRVEGIKAHKRQYKNALRGFQKLIQILTQFSEQPFLWPCHVAAGAVLCWQHKYMEAEEHVSSSLKFHKDFFGSKSPEYNYSLFLLGFILLCRNQLPRAEVCLRESYNNLAELIDGDLEDKLLAAQQLGICYMCHGRLEDAKDRLDHVLRGQMSRKSSNRSSLRLTSRCLAVLEALSGNWVQSELRFKVGIGEEGGDHVHGDEKQLDELGGIIGKWGLAWVSFERGNLGSASRLLLEAHRGLVAKLGDEHKLTISNEHDVLLVTQKGQVLLEKLQALQSKSLGVLGGNHQLTAKIEQSIQHFKSIPAALTSFECWPQRCYIIGSAQDRAPQIAEIDWLGWCWAEQYRGITVDEFATPVLARAGTFPMVAPAEHDIKKQPGWWEVQSSQDTAIPNLQTNPERKLPTTVFKVLKDLYVKLVLDFPRDFSPAFVETQYESSKDVPLEVMQDLGTGGFSKGAVQKVRNPMTDEVFARKCLTYTRSVDERAKVHSEVSAMRKLAHPHIVKLCASYVIPSEGIYALLLQPVADSNLTTFMHLCDQEDFPAHRLQSLKSWLPCLTSALDYMHAREVLHRDIKPENILVKGTQIYFTDFGIARDWDTKSSTAVTAGNITGTRRYMAPEIVACQRRGRASDIFSLGCVFAEMATLFDLQQPVIKFEGYRANTCSTINYSECVEDDGLDDWFGECETYAVLIKPMFAMEPAHRPLTPRLIELLRSGACRQVGSRAECLHKPSETDKA